MRQGQIIGLRIGIGALLLVTALLFTSIPWWCLKMGFGTARILTHSFPVTVLVEGKEVVGSRGYLNEKGWEHRKLGLPELIIWVPQSPPGIQSSDSRMVFTIVRQPPEGYDWVGLPGDGRRESQRLLFGRYLLQAETAGRSVPLGSVKSGYGEPKLRFETSAIKFKLTPCAECPGFSEQEITIYCPYETIRRIDAHSN